MRSAGLPQRAALGMCPAWHLPAPLTRSLQKQRKRQTNASSWRGNIHLPSANGVRGRCVTRSTMMGGRVRHPAGLPAEVVALADQTQEADHQCYLKGGAFRALRQLQNCHRVDHQIPLAAKVLALRNAPAREVVRQAFRQALHGWAEEFHQYLRKALPKKAHFALMVHGSWTRLLARERAK